MVTTAFLVTSPRQWLPGAAAPLQRHRGVGMFTDCLATVIAWARLLRDVTALRGRVFTELCIMIGVGVRDVTRGNAEFT